jgi:hypothetical protein
VNKTAIPAALSLEMAVSRAGGSRTSSAGSILFAPFGISTNLVPSETGIHMVYVHAPGPDRLHRRRRQLRHRALTESHQSRRGHRRLLLRSPAAAPQRPPRAASLHIQPCVLPGRPAAAVCTKFSTDTAVDLLSS